MPEKTDYPVENDDHEAPAVQHALQFKMQKPTGLFNTFRLGKKWAALRRNETVQLMAPGEGEDEWERYGVGLVLRVDMGPIEDMLEKHVGLNHGVQSIRQASDQRLALMTQLEGIYGAIPTGAVVTVVYVLGEELPA